MVKNVRQRKGGAQEGVDDVDASLEADGDGPRGGPLQRPLLIFLSVVQFCCLLGYGGVGYHKWQWSHVLRVTDDNLMGHVANHTNGTVVYFHSQSCVSCKTLTPEYLKAAQELYPWNVPLAMARLDEVPEAAARFLVRRVPTLLLFKRGRLISEIPDAARTAETLVAYVNVTRQPAMVLFQNRSELEDSLADLRSMIQAKVPPIIVGFHGHPGVQDALEVAAERSRGKTVFIFVEEAKPSDPPIKALYRSADKDLDYKGRVGPEAVDAWVQGQIERVS